MCGIVGYIGKADGVDFVLEGLKELEYRGYDSAGIACINKDQDPFILKEVGRITNLEKSLKKQKVSSSLVIGHTRWATHGKPTKSNSHPHFNNAKTIYVVHNGIIENYLDIKKELIEKGYSFYSETDTEVIPNLIDYYYSKTKEFKKAIKLALGDLKGTYALLIASSLLKDRLYLARLGSPLVAGFAKNYMIVASDQNVILKHTQKVTYLEDFDLAEISGNKIKIENLKTLKVYDPKIEILDFNLKEDSLNDFPDYMLKEIFDIPETIRLATKGRIDPKKGLVKLGGLDNVMSQLEHIDRIIIVACGTSYYAGMFGEYLIEEISDIPVEVVLASEFKYKKEPISRSTCVIAISQSGETADTIAALEKVKDFGVLKLGIVNVIGSTISRITDAGVYCHAGTEKAVASTKAFVSQVVILTLMSLRLKNVSNKQSKQILKEIENLPSKIEGLLSKKNEIKKLSQKYSKYKDFLFIGRGYDYPTALEGALKLKEVSYIHAEGYAAGEMKHGPLAMIDQNFPTVAVIGDEVLYEKTFSNIEEIRARKGPVLLVSSTLNKKTKNMVDDVFYLPKSSNHIGSILAAVFLQLFAYYVSKDLGFNVDRPRNLAKSVTVE